MHQLRLDSPGRRKIKYCPCGRDNRDGKFAPFTGYVNFGHCHGCDKTYFPPKGKDSTTRLPNPQKPQKNQKSPITIIPNDLVRGNVCDHSKGNLIKWLGCESRRDRSEIPLTSDQVKNIIDRYWIRGSNVYRNGVAFIYIDINSNVRQIKAMGYDAKTGKRIKEPFPEVLQIGKKIMLEAGAEEINIVPCFFGEHLLAANNSEVFVFESEATAIYASVFFPEKVCIATGGKNGCRWDNPEQFNVLKGRRVVLWPDIDAHEEWEIRAEALTKAGISVHLEESIVNAAKNQSQVTGVSYEAYKALKFDLRDILIYKEPIIKCSATTSPPLVAPSNTPGSVPSSNILKDFETIVTPTEPTKPILKFDPDEYKIWFDSIELPKYPIYLSENLQIHDAVAFVTGRLNHIRAFSNNREAGNRNLFNIQLQQLRNLLSE